MSKSEHERVYPGGMNPACIGCPVVERCMELIEDREAEMARLLGSLVAIRDEYGVLRNRTEYELSEQLDDATEKQISLYQQVVEGDKAKLVDYTTTCAGKKRSIIKVGAAKCGLSELDQRLMTPFS